MPAVFSEQTLKFIAGIQRLDRLYRSNPLAVTAAQLVQMRLQLGKQRREESGGEYGRVASISEGVLPAGGPLPEVAGGDLDAYVLADGILNHGALVVRKLYSDAQVEHLRELAESQVEQAPAPQEGLGCSAGTCMELLDIYWDSGLLPAVNAYQAGSTLMFSERTKLRRQLRRRDKLSAIPWHQDAAFFGGQRGAVNCWAAITPCGEENPSLSIVPRRFDHLIGWREQSGLAPLDYGRTESREAFDTLLQDEDCQPANCVLQPGDAVLFDEMTVHRTWSRPWRREDQIVSVSWFFPAGAFPDWGTPFAVERC